MIFKTQLDIYLPILLKLSKSFLQELDVAEGSYKETRHVLQTAGESVGYVTRTKAKTVNAASHLSAQKPKALRPVVYSGSSPKRWGFKMLTSFTCEM